jgi:hypothetical protein
MIGAGVPPLTPVVVRGAEASGAALGAIVGGIMVLIAIALWIAFWLEARDGGSEGLVQSEDLVRLAPDGAGLVRVEAAHNSR